MKQIKRFSMCLVALMISVATYAADNNDALVGKWVQTLTESGITVVTSYEFMPDGEMVQVLNMVGTSPKVEIAGTARCKYEYKKNTIKFKFQPKDIDIEKFEIEGLPDGMAMMAIEQQKAEMAKMEQKLTDVKIEGNLLTAKLGNETITLIKVE